jgi:hypothetical protein
MKKFIPYVLSAFLTIAFSLSASEKALSQTNQKEDKIDTSSRVTGMPEGSYSYVTGLTEGRAKSLIGVVAGLVSLVIGWRAQARASSRSRVGQSPARIAVVLGLIAIVLSVVHLLTSNGGFGTGSGKAGAVVGLVFGVMGTILGGRALRSTRKPFAR